MAQKMDRNEEYTKRSVLPGNAVPRLYMQAKCWRVQNNWFSKHRANLTL